MRPARIATALALVAALAMPWLLRAVGMDFYLSLATRILVFAIAATSLNLLLGYAGMVSLGHAAFMGLGAYASGLLLSEGQQGLALHLAVTVAVTACAALVIGAISLRTRGVYFIMITLAFAQMLFYLANSIKGWGGDEGLRIRSRVRLPSGADLHDGPTLYYTALAALALCLLALWRLARSRIGLAVRALRDDELRAEALGLPTYRWKLAIFVVAGVVAGLAGALGANLQGYVSPSNLHWTQSGTLLVMVILGGAGTLWGGVAGAVALLLLEEALGAWTEHWEFWTGLVLLAAVLFARRGLAGLFAAEGERRLAVERQRNPSDARSAGVPGARCARSPPAYESADGPLLDIRGLRKSFGSLVVTDGVDLDVQAGEIHALIGPNGAGKTTLVAQLAGELASDAGSVSLAGRDISHLRMHQRARAGLVRSFQITRLFRSLTVAEHVAFAVQARGAGGRPVEDVLARVGLADRGYAGVDQLSHGEQRALEVGLTLASQPRLVLLDEPLAGMGPEESRAMTELIAGLRGECAVLLIEHDVQAVFRLAGRVSVLVAGAVVASGPPEAVRADPGVVAAYLGDEVVA
ncbi:branched-chain amino acid ABC transporter ATP-binding protein/permease [Ramlibacter alkalitolerans]|uniref:Branched-chain amino acid ABC transporter ATP-binding protein/permease n=1 Tax=Ramlibacter alkalitolerans TaxID=2039631 RepID=A0ABS1JSB1_9BURK|nr:branched-chain amino acid ABC transporter ATP-binding protein/permease [Ramlibacter alkalitolerans]MBL0427122.1 branched-chain amino acid ABC transporter ATP-binding protein/permease [Ramlibacter alkalitolerans]